MTAQHAIGSLISLISKSEIRYEGYLHFVNPDENTVGLKNVRMLGTEGRKKATGDDIPPSDQKYEFIIFRGADIKDLVLYQDNAQRNKPAGATNDPAIVQAMPAQSQGDTYADRVTGRAMAAAQATSATQSERRHDRKDDRHYHHQQQQHQHHSHHQYHHDPRRDGYHGHRGYDRRDAPRHDRYRTDRRGDGPRRRDEVHTGREFAPAIGRAKEEFKEDFDFTKCDEEYEKKKAEFEKAKIEARQAARSYDKNTFFDNISCEARDRMDGRGTGLRADRDEQKRTDTETFGSDMVGSLRGFRRGRGSRGRHRF